MFTAHWCGPCDIVTPEFEYLSMQYGTVTFLSVDVDDNTDLAYAHRIAGLPTFFSFRDAAQVDRFMGADKERIRRMVRGLAAS